jgi:hypothetical protein
LPVPYFTSTGLSETSQQSETGQSNLISNIRSHVLARG